MNTFAKFQKIRKQKAEERSVNQEKLNAKSMALDAKQKRLFDKVVENLKAFNNKTVEGRKLKVKKGHDVYKLYVDGVFAATFGVERLSSTCACEGPCEHETSYWHAINVVEKRSGGDYGAYFNCSQYPEKVDEDFPQAMSSFLDNIFMSINLREIS